MHYLMTMCAVISEHIGLYTDTEVQNFFCTAIQNAIKTYSLQFNLVWGPAEDYFQQSHRLQVECEHSLDNIGRV